MAIYKVHIDPHPADGTGEAPKIPRIERIKRSSMKDSGFTEPDELESWIVQNPSLIGSEVMIIATQYSYWESGLKESSRKRLDILGLTSNGELVVVELKRQKDADVHLQAISYAAMCSGFTYRSLAEAHSAWLRKGSSKYFGHTREVTVEEAFKCIGEHVDGIEDETETFPVPRIVLFAEKFAAETLTTAQWLWSLVPELSVTCIEYSIYGATEKLLDFDTVWPLTRSEDLTLRPIMADKVAQKNEQVEKKRSDNAVKLLLENDRIGEGERIELLVDDIPERYFLDDQRERMVNLMSKVKITWTNEGPPRSPLAVRGLDPVEDPEYYSPSGLWGRLQEEVGAAKKGMDVNTFFAASGGTLAELADEIRNAADQ